MEKNQDKEFDMKSVIKTCYASNTFLLFFVIGMAIFYDIYEIKTMLYFTSVVVVLYVLNFFIIAKEKTNIYIWMIYGIITAYMCIATACLGLNYGFNLYCMSIIPIIYIIKYLGYKVNCPPPNPHIISGGIVLCYLASVIYAVVFGPIYVINDKVAAIMLAINSVSVFGFLITYALLIVNTVIESDKKLTALAVRDPLTKLYNRRYMLEQMEEVIQIKETNPWIAMIDIDDFKMINDTYGHNKGDECISFVSDMLRKCCKGCILSRWGGEEFLVLSEGIIPISVLETLKTSIENAVFEGGNAKYSITVTIGVANRDEQSIEEWINLADERLYQGKNSGKNTVCVGE